MYAEPEVEIRQITAANPFLVIASDGVFEFLSDQDVVNMVRSLQTLIGIEKLVLIFHLLCGLLS